MEVQRQSKPLSKFILTLLDNATSNSQFITLQNDLLHLEEEEDQNLEDRSINPHKNEQETTNSAQKITIQETREETSTKEGTALRMQTPKIHEQAQKVIEVEEALRQDVPLSYRSNHEKIEERKERQPLSEPPLISAKRNHTEQSSQKSKNNLRESAQGSRKGNRKSSEQSSLNLELTQKTKRSKNLSFTQGRVDSLLYSDATLMYSNDTGFDREFSNHPQRIASHKSALNKILDDQEADIDTKMERAESRDMQRMRTESQKVSEPEREANQATQEQEEETNVFKTEINEYKSKISKIKELKVNKKRKLETELRRVNEELEELTKKEHEGSVSSNSKPKNFESRVKISDNVEAKVKAQRFVRDLNNQKRSRQDAHMGELHAIDKNINSYMQQLMRERYKNEERIKQRKKLEIIDRMKQQQMRKIEQQKQKDKNIQFVHQLRGSNSKNNLQNPKKSSQNPNLNYAQSVKSKERSPTKKSEPMEEVTPELSRKKAYLRKIRNLSFRKEKADAYEQLLN